MSIFTPEGKSVVGTIIGLAGLVVFLTSPLTVAELASRQCELDISDLPAFVGYVKMIGGLGLICGGVYYANKDN